MASKRTPKNDPKYTVDTYENGKAFFVFGGDISYNSFSCEADAQLVADALNMCERLKTRRLQANIENTLAILEDMANALTENPPS